MADITRAMIALSAAVQIYETEPQDDRYPSRLKPRAKAALALYMMASGTDDESKAHDAIIAKLEAFNAEKAKALFWRDARCAFERLHDDRNRDYDVTNPTGTELLKHYSDQANADYHAITEQLGISREDADAAVEDLHWDNCDLCGH